MVAHPASYEVPSGSKLGYSCNGPRARIQYIWRRPRHQRKSPLGPLYSADFGYEFSFSQSWAAALDVVYTYTQKTNFTGRAGTSATGAPNVVGGPFSDQLSLAPAIEYNVNSNIGFIGGVWFSVWEKLARLPLRHL